MDKIESFLHTNTSLRDYISFEEFKRGHNGVNQRLLRAVYQQLVAKDEERHDEVLDNIQQHSQLLQQQLQLISEPNDSDARADSGQLDRLAHKLAQKLDERVISLDLETDQLSRATAKKVEALNDLRYNTIERGIDETRKEVDALYSSLSSLH